jgi:hypothetical protein
MTNIRYIKKNRHPKKSRGGDSSGDISREEMRSYYQNDIVESLLSEKKKDEFGYRKWNQLNFK